MNAESVIQLFGGEAELASEFEVSPKAVEQWGRRDRIPGKYHLLLLDLAERQGVALTPTDLLSTTRRK